MSWLPRQSDTDEGNHSLQSHRVTGTDPPQVVLVTPHPPPPLHLSLYEYGRSQHFLSGNGPHVDPQHPMPVETVLREGQEAAGRAMAALTSNSGVAAAMPPHQALYHLHPNQHQGIAHLHKTGNQITNRTGTIESSNNRLPSVTSHLTQPPMTPSLTTSTKTSCDVTVTAAAAHPAMEANNTNHAGVNNSEGLLAGNVDSDEQLESADEASNGANDGISPQYHTNKLHEPPSSLAIPSSLPHDVYKDYTQMQDFHTAVRAVDSAYNLMAIHVNGGSKPSIAWQPVSANSNEYQPVELTFHAPTGPTHDSSGDSPLDIFRRMLDTALVDMIIAEMNRFGRKILNAEVCVGPKKKKLRSDIQQNRSDHNRNRKKNSEWIDVDVMEFWSFMAVMFYMSVVKIPTIKRYWNKDLWGQPTVQSLMKRDRFCILLRCFEFADQQDSDSVDHPNLERITPILTKMCSNFRREYRPECHLSLDETMLQSNGKFKYRAVAGDEETPLAVRTYILCEAKSGYALDFFVHTGKSTSYNSELSSRFNSNICSELAVCRLLSNYSGKGHILYSDRFYSSPHLFAFLKSEADIDCVGLTQPLVEGFPSEIQPASSLIGKGDVLSMVGHVYKATVLAQTWRLKDEGPPSFVSILSTRNTAATKVVAQKNKGYLYKPVSYLEYQEHCGGISKVDRTFAQFPGEDGPPTKYPYKVFLRFVHLALHNAYVVWRCFGPKPNLGYGTNFRLQLMKELKHETDAYKQLPNPVIFTSGEANGGVGGVRAGHTSPTTTTTTTTSSPLQQHVLTKTAPMVSNLKRRSRRRCVHCWNTSDKRSQTTFECKLCNQGFCPPCFDVYHANLKLT